MIFHETNSKVTSFVGFQYIQFANALGTQAITVRERQVKTMAASTLLHTSSTYQQQEYWRCCLTGFSLILDKSWTTRYVLLLEKDWNIFA